jgi:hypothetical protein
MLIFFDADPGSGIRDGKKSDPGSRMEKIRIRDKHPGSATLQKIIFFKSNKGTRYPMKMKNSETYQLPVLYHLNPHVNQAYR